MPDIRLNPLDAAQSFRLTIAAGENTVLQAGSANHRHEFARSVISTLQSSPRWVDSRFLYDSFGSELYDLICRQPEYYLTCTEASILEQYGPEIADITGELDLVELGSGNAEKISSVIGPCLLRFKRLSYIPVDVCESSLRKGSLRLLAEFPELRIHGIHGTYEDAFPLIKHASPKMVLFLGSTIGNLGAIDTEHFLASLAAALSPGDYFLVGADLVKKKEVLEAAYNDAAGVTAAFTRNLFARMNRELGATIDVDAVEHVACYNTGLQQIEIYARFTTCQEIAIPEFSRFFSIAEGECILTEISRKFRLSELQPYLESFGFETKRVFTDDRRWYSLILLKKAGSTTIALQ